MTTKRRWLLVLTIVLLLAVVALMVSSKFLRVAGAASSDASAEYAKFQGTWEFLSMEVDGAAKPEQDYKKYTAVFKDEVWTVLEGTNVAAQTPFQLDPSGEPKTIDLFPTDGRVLQGIYKLEGDRFTMCDRGTERGPRPTKFATERDSGLVLVTLRRVSR